MNLKELDSFKMADAIAFHDKLNPKLWSNNNLRPEVKKQLLIIAQDFLEELGVSNLDVKDITVSGSNAAFSYTPHSDLDLHILVDLSELDNNEVYKELFNAKKNIYNDNHNITIHGVPVELYVQDAREPVVSLGEYSILNDKWLRLPTKRRANFDQTATKSKYEKLLSLVEIGLRSKDIGKVSNILKKIKQYRQAGLDKGGEFGPENLAYKALRSQGLITKLYDLRDRLHDEILTIETMYQDPIKIQEAFDQSYKLKWEKGDHGDVDAYAKLDDGNYLSIMFNKGYSQGSKEEAWSVEFFRNNSQEVTGEGDQQRVFATVLSAIQTFIKKYKPNRIIFSASKEVEKNQDPRKALTRSRLYDSLVQRYAKAWGFRAFRADTGDKVIYELNRIKPVKEDAETTTEHYNGIEISLEIEDDEVMVTAMMANGREMGHVLFIQEGDYLMPQDLEVEERYQGQGIAATMYDYVKSKGYKIRRSGQQTDAGAGFWNKHRPEQNVWEDDTMQYAAEKTSAVNPYGGLKDNQYRGSISEASGYIPSEREKNDPRFKTALTVDIKPDSIKKNAKAFSWLTDRAGIPPTAKPNGKI